MTILVTGSTGFLGPHLMVALKDTYPDVVGVSRSGGSDYQYDLTDSNAVQHLLSRASPAVIIHAAAMTDVTRCQQEPELAVKVNSGAVKNIVTHMPDGCRLIYISTDMVYSGGGPHREFSKSENPINMYGLSKFMGEFEAARAKNHLILRTNMYGFGARIKKSSSLVDFLVQKFKSGEPFQIFTDTLFSPLHVKTLSDLIVKLCKKNKVGTFNAGSTNGMSKSKFALLLANKMNLPIGGARPVESSSIPNRIPRPLDMRLDITRIEALGFSMPQMEDDLTKMCEMYKWTN